ncbi:MAG TPA: redoxin domain-containing protein [Terriglobia bacterium]|nr:redoxin domain-containing protein [Terriglobia bacterium]
MAELGGFAKHHQEIHDLDVRFPAISMDSIEQVKETRAKLKAPIAMLSDSQDQVMDLYGTRSPVCKGKNDSAINTPTLVPIDKKGSIHWLRLAADYRIRAPISEVLNEIHKLR